MILASLIPSIREARGYLDDMDATEERELEMSTARRIERDLYYKLAERKDFNLAKLEIMEDLRDKHYPELSAAYFRIVERCVVFLLRSELTAHEARQFSDRLCSMGMSELSREVRGIADQMVA